MNSLPPSELVTVLGFDDALKIACAMLNNEKWDDVLQNYATDVLEELQNKYKERWNSNWRYDALQGSAYDIILKYDERYLAFKRAFEKVSPQPPELLVAMARCCWAPGIPPITEADAVLLAKEAVQKIPYIEGIDLLKGLYKSMGNKEQQIYYENLLKEISLNGIHLPRLDQIDRLDYCN